MSESPTREYGLAGGRARTATSDLQEFMRLIMQCWENGQEWMLSGSFSELPLMYSLNYFNDLDLMIYAKNTFAIQEKKNRNLPIKRNICLLYIDTHGCHPGFSRIRTKDGILLKHYTGDDIFPMQGPSRKHEFTNDLLKPAFNNAGDVYTVDFVRCVFSPSWPTVANEWMNRERKHGWPSEDLIRKVVSGGCHLVGKSHQSHPGDNTEWRFSFSRAELILVTSWSQHQVYIYHALRLIKKHLIRFCGDEENATFSTYHIKTRMLWACEEKSEEFWIEKNIVSSINEILLNLVECLIDKNLPSYFIPTNNILDHVADSEDFEKEIRFILQWITEDCTTALLKQAHPACLDCKVTLNLANTALLNICCRFYAYNNNYFPDDGEISKEHEQLKTGLLRKDIESLFRGIQSQIVLMRKKETPNLEDTEVMESDIGECFRKSVEENDLGFTKVNVSINSGVHFFRSLGVRANYVDKFNTDQNSTNLNVKVTCKHSTNDGIEHVPEGAINLLISRTIEFYAGPSYFYGLVFGANFHYVTKLDYQSAVKLCEVGIKAPHRLRSSTALPFMFASDFAILYDRPMQTVMGFLLVFARVVVPKTQNPRVCLRMSTLMFLHYIRIQCFVRQRQLRLSVQGAVKEFRRLQLSGGFHEDGQVLDYQVIVASLRTSGVYI